MISQILAQKQNHYLQPEILKKNTLKQILRLAKAGIIEKDVSDELYKATHILQSIQTMLRLCLDNDAVKQEKPYALLLTLAHRFDTEPEKLEDLILENQNFIHNLYYEIIETPALEMEPVDPIPPLDNKE